MIGFGLIWKKLFLYACFVLVGNIHNASGDQLPCNPKYPYRTYDGSCNNLEQPSYGVAGSMFRRILPPKYENDDGQTPRLTGVGGSPLPSPRAVSTKVHESEKHSANQATMMFMQWAQFVDHDLTYTPKTPMVKCCSKNLLWSGHHHPDVMHGGPCFPIFVDEHDPYFRDDTTRCLEFRRSQPRYDSHKVRQQINEVTSWLDASHIYGNSESQALSLRSFKDGKLKVKVIHGHEFLPEADDTEEKKCFLMEKGDYCFKAGDIRVNEYPGLTALQTIFMRYHNQICDRLRHIHHEWEDEILYQEARRVVIAVIQRITYDKFISQLLGPLAAKHDLLPGAHHYDEKIDPTPANVFATAAFRFGHSLIKDSLTIDGELVKTGEFFMRPKFVINSLPGVVKALISELCQETDIYYTKAMTEHMFEVPYKPKTGHDIVSTNIQRGRDHGIPPYNDWREYFGLKRKTFKTMDSGSKKYSQVYDSADDIDLYSGAISEHNIEGGMVGEVYSKILVQHFRHVKFADRFWYENRGGKASFTKKQIREIHKMSLSKVICDTVPGFKRIQPNVFEPVGHDNSMIECSIYDDINFEKFWA
ncbi:peroxidase [Biomphalaria glabrata]|nr:peroxidase [Biomphalaria glabrata]